MKRILVLCHSASIGGAELALASLIESTHQTYEWHVVFADTKKAPSVLTEHTTKVDYLDLPWWCHEAHDKPKPINKKSFYKTINKLEKLCGDADVLLTNTITIPWLGFIAEKINKPHIWYIHEFGDIDHNLKFITGYNESLVVISKNSSRVLTISEAVKQHIAKVIPKDKIDIINQSIDFSQIPFSPTDLQNTDTVRLAVLGAMKPSKGQHIALGAAKALRAISGKPFTLDIIGPNANESYVNKLLIDAADTTGITIQSRYFKLEEELRSHDVLIMASESEALGRVTLEGLAAGKTVVGYACKATEDLLKDNRGILYKPNNSGALAKVLNNLALLSAHINYKDNQTFAKNSHGAIRQSTDFQVCVEKSNNEKILPNSTFADYENVLTERKIFIGSIQNIKSKTKRKLAKNTPNTIKTTARKLRLLK